MKLVRRFSLALLTLGATLLVLGIACSGSDDKKEEAATPTSEAATGTATQTATPTETPPPTPTATPTPFDGKVARLKVPRFNVDAPIEELAVNSNNEMETPQDENRAVGWYWIYDKPGHGGNAVFSAHVYYRNVPAPFVNLAKSVEGDKVSVTMENGLEYHYQVISNKRYHRDTIDMGAVLWPPEKAQNDEWITLITCGGQLDSTGQEYISRDVVVARRVQGP